MSQNEWTAEDSINEMRRQMQGQQNANITVVTSPSKWQGELTRLEKKRVGLHNYITMKLEDRDYHGVADAAMDLRELDERARTIKEWLNQ